MVMSDRVVILLQRGSKGPPRIVLEDPADVPDADVGVDVIADPEREQLLARAKSGPWDPDVVERIGTSLCNLLKEQPAIKKDFETRLRETTLDGPIYLRIEPPELEEWPWEALNDPDAGFLALQRPWPIARVRRVPKPKPEYVFIPPLRIVAVLGASGSTAETRISAREEWNRLFGAIKESPLNITVDVFVAEDELLQEIQALNLPWVKGDFLDDDDELFREIKRVRPHLLHFFCHGVAGSPPILEIASRLNWRQKQDGSIKVDASQLRDRADPEPQSNVWLITLNCCESAQSLGAGSRSRAMASSLVMKGFPAVVGMRQRVDSSHASRFCGLWYESLLQELGERFESGSDGTQPEEFHWARALFAARQGICRTVVDDVPFTASAPRVVEWTIPILYTRYPPFVIRVGTDPENKNAVLRAPAAAVPPAAPALVPPPAAPAAAGAAAAPVPVVVPPVGVAAGGVVAPAADAAARPALSVQEKLKLTAEMQQLLEARGALAAQATIPEPIRNGVLRDINARLDEITALLV
jgi:hypothetical protein